MLQTILYIAFTLAAVFLIAIVLLQEGKGGGLGAAFGGAGGEAFGHGAGGINRFTAYVAGAFMVLALFISIFGEG